MEKKLEELMNFAGHVYSSDKASLEERKHDIYLKADELYHKHQSLSETEKTLNEKFE